jgi:hypothetical protein
MRFPGKESVVVHAIIHNGRVEPQESLPSSWEGQAVKIEPLTPDDPVPDLERWLAELHAMGPMERDHAERAQITDELREWDEVSESAMRRLMGMTP